MRWVYLLVLLAPQYSFWDGPWAWMMWWLVTTRNKGLLSGWAQLMNETKTSTPLLMEPITWRVIICRGCLSLRPPTKQHLTWIVRWFRFSWMKTWKLFPKKKQQIRWIQLGVCMGFICWQKLIWHLSKTMQPTLRVLWCDGNFQIVDIIDFRWNRSAR